MMQVGSKSVHIGRRWLDGEGSPSSDSTRRRRRPAALSGCGSRTAMGRRPVRPETSSIRTRALRLMSGNSGISFQSGDTSRSRRFHVEDLRLAYRSHRIGEVRSGKASAPPLGLIQADVDPVAAHSADLRVVWAADACEVCRGVDPKYSRACASILASTSAPHGNPQTSLRRTQQHPPSSAGSSHARPNCRSRRRSPPWRGASESADRRARRPGPARRTTVGRASNSPFPPSFRPPQDESLPHSGPV